MLYYDPRRMVFIKNASQLRGNSTIQMWTAQASNVTYYKYTIEGAMPVFLIRTPRLPVVCLCATFRVSVFASALRTIESRTPR